MHPLSCGGPLHLACQEFANAAGNEVAILFQREVTRVEQMELEVVQVTLVGFSPFRREDVVTLSPDDQRRRLMLPEISLPTGIERRVGAVIVEHR